MQITPAEFVWSLLALLVAIVVLIALGVLAVEDDSYPPGIFPSLLETKSQHLEQSVARTYSWADLAAEATRTDTLLWYAGRLLDSP